jgi:hypothetical protein
LPDVKAVAALTVSAGVALLLMWSGCGRGGKVERGPYAALGEVAAKAISGLLEGKGKLVLLVSEADNNSATAVGVAVKAFNETLKQARGVQVAATEAIKPAMAVALSGAEPLTPERFVELVSKHAAADALVSFVGVPRLTPAQIGRLPQPRPKIVAVVTYNPPTKALFAQGVLQLAILARPAAAPSARTPVTSQEWFDANYQLVTAATAGSLPF